MAIHLRTYRPSDLKDLYSVDVLCFDPPFRFTRAAIRLFAEAENAITRVAVEPDTDTPSERIVGFCIVHLEETGRDLAGYVVTIDVHPDQRGRGIGPALMHAVESAARDAGATAMLLHVSTKNHPAIRLYDRLGYSYDRAVKGFYGEGFDALVYRKPLVAQGQIGSRDAQAGSGNFGVR